MASEIDRQLNAAMDWLTAPGGPLETEMVMRGGNALPAFKQAPASLAAMFESIADALPDEAADLAHRVGAEVFADDVPAQRQR